MILIDYSAVFLSSLFAQYPPNRTSEFSEELIRHIVLSSLLSYKKQFGEQYGQLVICADSVHYWRKDVFPFYKANRKKAREAIKVDWNSIFDSLNKIKQELMENFPYKVIEVYGAEADDVIAVLAKNTTERTVIVASDNDYLQLQGNPLVRQWAPSKKKFVTSKNVLLDLKEKIISGDRGDGIPNIMSEDNVLKEGIKQKAITTKRLNEFIKNDPKAYDSEVKKRFDRNQRLIDFDYIPNDLEEKIQSVFNEYVPKKKFVPTKYFIDNELKILLQHVQEF